MEICIPQFYIYNTHTKKNLTTFKGYHLTYMQNKKKNAYKRLWEFVPVTIIVIMHLLRLYLLKLSGRIDYSHWPGLIYWKPAARFEIDRPWNDFENFNSVAYPISSPANGIRHPISFFFVGRRLLWNFHSAGRPFLIKSVLVFYLSHLERRVFRPLAITNYVRVANKLMDSCKKKIFSLTVWVTKLVRISYN